MIIGGKEGEDDEPDKMAIAIGRFGRLKRWIKGQIVKGCIGMKNKTIKAIRGGPRPEENEIALEVNPEMDLFQVLTLVSDHRILSYNESYIYSTKCYKLNFREKMEI